MYYYEILLPGYLVAQHLKRFSMALLGRRRIALKAMDGRGGVAERLNACSNIR